jgi:RNA polymerase sporulation-specific sigma factor
MDRTYELIERSQKGDLSARERLIIDNAGLVWSVVRKFTGRGYEPDDLFQIGAIGLLKCIDKFDPSFGVRFSTYAIPMIMGEIRRFIRDDGLIKVARPLKEMAVKAKYKQEALRVQHGRDPSIAELAVALDADVEELVLAMETSLDVESLDSLVYRNDGNPVPLIDKIEPAANETDSVTDLILLKEMIGQLDQKERQVIVMRYFQDKTQSEVARIIGVSQVQVSRIEKRALGYMRRKMGDGE